jgi:hypothetical protein
VEDETDEIVPPRHLQQLRASVNHIANNFPAAIRSPPVLAVLSPLIATGSLEEARLMLLRIISYHPRPIQQLLHDMNQLCTATVEAAVVEAANVADVDMEDGEIRENR